MQGKIVRIVYWELSFLVTSRLAFLQKKRVLLNSTMLTHQYSLLTAYFVTQARVENTFIWSFDTISE